MVESKSGQKTRVLVVGATGYIGKRIVKACLAEGHETYVLQRPEIGLDIEKVQLLLSFKKLGARVVEASFSDHRSLVSAVKLVDVVVSAMSGVHFRSHNILVQLKLVEAIKEAGNVKYECRKTLADSRPRIRGRFARNDEMSQQEQVDVIEAVVGDVDTWASFLDSFSANHFLN